MTGDYHGTRFQYDDRRDVLWQTLWDAFFRHRISPAACVLEIGCGYGHFINKVKARRRMALDNWPGIKDYLDEGVEAIIADGADLSMLEDGAIDFAFASNLLEHLSKDQVGSLLSTLRPKLSATGVLTILQPNYRYAFREYFDDYTHVSIWSHIALQDFLEAHGFEIVEAHPKFLPLTIKSSLPVWPLLIRAYLALPMKPMAKQMLIVARPINNPTT